MNERDFPLVSIVTATYMHFDKLYRTIDSVYMQDYPNIEYIITDDGSSNFPINMIEDYLASQHRANVKYQIIHHTKNCGTVKNLNNAYRQTNGTYVFNLSCGDVFFDQDVVKKLVERLQTTDGDVLVASRILYEGDFEPICFLPHYDERKIIESYSTNLLQYKAFITNRYYDMASGSAMYFSKRILTKLGYFDERFFLWEDGPFLSKYLTEYSLTFAYDIIAIWYETGGVSTVHTGTISSIMQADIEKFHRIASLAHKDLLTLEEKRLVIFESKHFLWRRIKYRLCFLNIFFLPEYFQRRKYNKRREKSFDNDRKMLNDFLRIRS